MPADKIRRWREKPHTMVRELFNATPDVWQDEALSCFPTTPRIAMKASKGPGKTCVLSWLAWSYLLTRPHPNIAATSISGDNLRDGLWKEMAMWRNASPLLQANFEITSERIFARQHPQTWFMSARTWNKSANKMDLGNTLAGLRSNYTLFLLDETGSMPPEILMSAEGALTNVGEGREAHIVQAGNTNTLDGALYYACVKHAGLWKTVVISGDPDDPKRSTRVSLEWARELIRDYGRDSPYVKVMVLGEWPPHSLDALIGPDEVEAAMKRKYQEHDIAHAPRILGVDVARQGDDASIIFPRQGLVAFKPHVMRNVTGVVGGGQVARVWADWKVDACFVDNTGGFGAAWIDILTTLGRSPIPVGFADTDPDKRYYNKRAAMYFRAVQWIKNGGALPPDPDIVAELSQTTYTFRGDSLLLEPKDMVKAKLNRSPDKSDALVLTFAEEVAPKQTAIVPQRVRRDEAYDPFQEFLRSVG
jgi:hypothetical protein